MVHNQKKGFGMLKPLHVLLNKNLASGLATKIRHHSSTGCGLEVKQPSIQLWG